MPPLQHIFWSHAGTVYRCGVVQRFTITGTDSIDVLTERYRRLFEHWHKIPVVSIKLERQGREMVVTIHHAPIATETRARSKRGGTKPEPHSFQFAAAL